MSFLVTGSFYWYQNICPCEFDHLWNWSLLRTFLFHKHILFHILHGFTIYMVIWWDCKSFLCPGKFIIVHNVKNRYWMFFVSLLYFSVNSDVNFQNKGTHWTPLHAATFQEHGPVSLFFTHLCPNAIFFCLKSGLLFC